MTELSFTEQWAMEDHIFRQLLDESGVEVLGEATVGSETSRSSLVVTEGDTPEKVDAVLAAFNEAQRISRGLSRDSDEYLLLTDPEAYARKMTQQDP